MISFGRFDALNRILALKLVGRRPWLVRNEFVVQVLRTYPCASGATDPGNTKNLGNEFCKFRTKTEGVNWEFMVACARG